MFRLFLFVFFLSSGRGAQPGKKEGYSKLQTCPMHMYNELLTPSEKTRIGNYVKRRALVTAPVTLPLAAGAGAVGGSLAGFASFMDGLVAYEDKRDKILAGPKFRYSRNFIRYGLLPLELIGGCVAAAGMTAGGSIAGAVALPATAVYHMKAHSVTRQIKTLPNTCLAKILQDVNDRFHEDRTVNPEMTKAKVQPIHALLSMHQSDKKKAEKIKTQMKTNQWAGEDVTQAIITFEGMNNLTKLEFTFRLFYPKDQQKLIVKHYQETVKECSES